MGIAIHYRGKINDLAMVTTLADELEDFAQSLSWRTHHWRVGWQSRTLKEAHRQRGETRIIGHVPLQGITLFLHKDCEPLSLTFDPNGYLVEPASTAIVAKGKMKPEGSWISIKTQFAPIETHVSVIKLLQHLEKRYIANLEVHDEGGYWESGDVCELRRRIDSISRSLDVIDAALSTLQFNRPKTNCPEEFVQIIERILKVKLGR